MTVVCSPEKALRLLSVSCAVCCACLLGPPPSAAASDARGARIDLAKDYAQIDDAFSRRNVDDALAFCTSDYVIVELGQTTNLAAERNGGRQQLNAARWAQSRTKITKLSVSGDKATVLIVQRLRIIGPVNGIMELTDCTETGRDLWVNNGSGWRLKKSWVLTQKTAVESPPSSGSGAGVGKA